MAFGGGPFPIRRNLARSRAACYGTSVRLNRRPSLNRARVLTALCTGALLVLGAAFTASSCSTGARGIAACREIEYARCQASTACGFTAAEVSSCELLYRDQCLQGIENETAEPDQGSVDLCVLAVKNTAACATAGDATMQACTAVALTATTALQSEVLTPCDVMMHAPEYLADCAFIIEPPEAGVVPFDANDGFDANPDVFILGKRGFDGGFR